MSPLAPIVLFVYNRLDHLKRTIESLQRNAEAAYSLLYVFSDGSKKSDESNNVFAVRDYLKHISGFKSVEIIVRNANLGLANSIINGVSQVIDAHGKVIVIEDDLVVSPYFLKYMNDALEYYKNEEKVISIMGYSYPVREILPETFFLKGAECWGWATWKRGWALFESDGRKLLAELKKRKLEYAFDWQGSYPYTKMLKDQIAGKNNSWAIRWQASAFLRDKLSLYPRNSLVDNIGFDESGTHCGKNNLFSVNLYLSPVTVSDIPIEESEDALRAIVNFSKEVHSSSRIFNAFLNGEIPFNDLIKKILKRIVSQKNIKKIYKLQYKFNEYQTMNKSLDDKYPRILGDELNAVNRVLNSGRWNLHSGNYLTHNLLEETFADYIGTKYAVAVNTGGMALQMALRAVGVKPGVEVVHQVDTCVANAFGVLAAGGTPIFSDIDQNSFMLNEQSLVSRISENTKVIVPIHMWGNYENMEMVLRIAKIHNAYIIEDACLGLGACKNGKMAGSNGCAAIFSFGTLKPIQAGEGGMIVTDDEALARELRTIRVWGDRSQEYGVRDYKTPSWNGRMSEIVAAIVLEQLKQYPLLLNSLRENVACFIDHARNWDGISIVLPGGDIHSSAFTQVVIKMDAAKIGVKKSVFMNMLREKGIVVWHANFELLNSVSFFNSNMWRDWIVKGDVQRISENYADDYPVARCVYERTGLGFFRENFLSLKKTNLMISKIEEVLSHNGI